MGKKQEVKEKTVAVDDTSKEPMGYLEEKIKSLEEANLKLQEDFKKQKELHNGELKALEAELLEKHKLELEAERSQVEKLEEIVKKSLSKEPDNVVHKSQKVVVKHGVSIRGKKYSKEEIEKDTTIQEYLLSICSGAIEVKD